MKRVPTVVWPASEAQPESSENKSDRSTPEQVKQVPPVVSPPLPPVGAAEFALLVYKLLEIDLKWTPEQVKEISKLLSPIDLKWTPGQIPRLLSPTLPPELEARIALLAELAHKLPEINLKSTSEHVKLIHQSLHPSIPSRLRDRYLHW